MLSAVSSIFSAIALRSLPCVSGSCTSASSRATRTTGPPGSSATAQSQSSSLCSANAWLMVRWRLCASRSAWNAAASGTSPLWSRISEYTNARPRRRSNATAGAHRITPGSTRASTPSLTCGMLGRCVASCSRAVWLPAGISVTCPISSITATSIVAAFCTVSVGCTSSTTVPSASHTPTRTRSIWRGMSVEAMERASANPASQRNEPSALFEHVNPVQRRQCPLALQNAL